MPTFESLAALQRQLAKLEAERRAAFRRAVAEFVANLKASEGFSPELRVNKLVNTEIWSLTWAKRWPRALPVRLAGRPGRDAHHLGSDRNPRRDLRPDAVDGLSRRVDQPDTRKFPNDGRVGRRGCDL